jgi:hypothetical protein
MTDPTEDETVSEADSETEPDDVNERLDWLVDRLVTVLDLLW